MTTLAPDRSLEQRIAALGRANDIRTDRATLKRDIKAGRVGLAKLCALISDPPAELLTMKLFALLMAVPKVGEVRVNRVLFRHAISPSKTIGGLSERQRGQLVAWLVRRGL
jgi:hypothetical protein